jgi:DNA-binding transcriptional regulator YhcF (GntR family)
MPHLRRDAVTNELRNRVVAGLHVGRWRGGERLPSVRTLASELDVNERVVLAAMRTLADEGLVEVRPRSGVYATLPQAANGATMSNLEAWLVTMLAHARSRGLAPKRVADFVRRALSARSVRAACIECNHDQTQLLCEELTALGYTADSIALGMLGNDPPASVHFADVLVTTVFHADRVQRIARRLGKPWIAVALRPDLMRDVGRYLRSGPVYWMATDPLFERKLRRIVAPVSPIANLRVVLLDRDDVDSIPADAPTFIMPSAQSRLRRRFGNRGPGRPIQPPTMISDDSARQLLTFLVRANLAGN